MTDLRRLPKRLTPLARFELSYIPEPMSGCWLWLGRPRGTMGYGAFKMHRLLHSAHRASWMLFRGHIPADLSVLHNCDNPACVNPSHLFLGTTQDNSDDKVRKGRQARGERLGHPRARGEANGNAKLTIQAVNEIRAATIPQRAIAKAYGVTQALVSKIQRGEIWK